MKNNNIEKEIYNSPTLKESIKLASETILEEKRLSDYMDKLYDEGLEKFKKKILAKQKMITSKKYDWVSDLVAK